MLIQNELSWTWSFRLSCTVCATISVVYLLDAAVEIFLHFNVPRHFIEVPVSTQKQILHNMKKRKIYHWVSQSVIYPNVQRSSDHGIRFTTVVMHETCSIVHIYNFTDTSKELFARTLSILARDHFKGQAVHTFVSVQFVCINFYLTNGQLNQAARAVSHHWRVRIEMQFPKPSISHQKSGLPAIQS